MNDGLHLYENDGTMFLPSEYCRGPWRHDAQHGGPPSALLAYLSEHELESDEFLTHIEVELLSPIPLTALRGSVSRVRISGRVYRIYAELYSGDKKVAQSSALVLKHDELEAPDWQQDQQRCDLPNEQVREVPPHWGVGHGIVFHRDAVEHRFAHGSFSVPGPALNWVRLRCAVVAGQAISPLQRVCAAADFGSGISAIYKSDSAIGMINANLSISLYRELEDDWVSLDSNSHVGPQGTGLGITLLGDTSGKVGVATQSLLALRMKG